VTFVSLRISVYLAILGINLPCRFEILAEVHLQVHYKANIIWVLNYVLEYNAHKNNTFLTHIKSNTRVYQPTYDSYLP
jgi:hypothetical protein